MANNKGYIKEIHRLLDRTVITPRHLLEREPGTERDMLPKLLAPLTNYMKNHRPKKLFHLRGSAQKCIDAFSNDEIYLTRADFFNDPYDCMLYFDEAAVLNEVKSEINVENLLATLPPSFEMSAEEDAEKAYHDFAAAVLPYRGEFLKKVSSMLPSVNIMLQRSMHIACFTEDETSPVMWAHYASNHEGFALEYQFRDDIFPPHLYSVPDVSYDWYGWRSLLPVLYSDVRKDGSVLANWYALCKCRGEIGMSGKEYDMSLFLPDLLLKTKFSLQKAAVWQYEAEWRMIWSTEWPNQVDEDRVYIQYPASAIYLGCRIAADTKKSLLDIAKRKGIPAFQMYIDYSAKEYKLSYRPL